jgi:HPt (histidine-containing phosphotransfer) domain-containing protein
MQSNLTDIRVLDTAVLDRLRDSLGPEAEGEIDTIVSMFFAHAATQLQAAREAVAQGNATRIGQLAHSLKGGALQLGAERIVQIALTLEDSARMEAIEEAGILVSRLVDAFDETRAAFHQLGLGGGG